MKISGLFLWFEIIEDVILAMYWWDVKDKYRLLFNTVPFKRDMCLIAAGILDSCRNTLDVRNVKLELDARVWLVLDTHFIDNLFLWMVCKHMWASLKPFLFGSQTETDSLSVLKFFQTSVSCLATPFTLSLKWVYRNVSETFTALAENTDQNSSKEPWDTCF